MQSQIPVTLLVEKKTGILAVLSTPLLEPPIQKPPKKAKKSAQKMFHVKHFLLQRFTLCQQEKKWGGNSPTHLLWLIRRMGWQFAHPSKDSLYNHAEPAFCHAEP